MGNNIQLNLLDSSFPFYNLGLFLGSFKNRTVAVISRERLVQDLDS